MRVFRSSVFLLAILFAAASAATDRVVLKVEGTAYTDDDFARYVQATAGMDRLSDAALSRLFDRYVEESLLLAAARRKGLTLTREEKDAYLARLSAGAAAGDPGATGVEADDERLFDGLLVEKYSSLILKDIRVEEAEIGAYYEAHKKDYLVSERIKVSQILCDTEDKAVAVLRELKNGSEEAFRKAARDKSAGPEAFKGGEMGIFKNGDLPLEMEKVVFSLEEGRLSPVFESSYGYHIFRVDKKIPPQLLSEREAAPSIRIKILDRKVQEALAAHLSELRLTLNWGSTPEKLSFSYQRNLP